MSCTSDHHRKHMCQLQARGEMETYQKLSANAMVECDKCGAKAASPEDVCDPIELPDIKDVGDAPEIR